MRLLQTLGRGVLGLVRRLVLPKCERDGHVWEYWRKSYLHFGGRWRWRKCTRCRCKERGWY